MLEVQRLAKRYGEVDVFRDVSLSVAARTGRILTVEDHGVVGGLGSAVLEALAEVPNVVVHVHGVRTYGESGTHEELFARHRLDTAGVAAVVKEVFGPGKRAKAAS